MPSCTSRDSHKTLSADLESILEKISTDNFAYKKASILRAALKERINDRISNVAMHATANAAEEFTKKHSRNSKRESSALDDEEYESSNDEEIALAQVEHGFENICSRASIS
ncbi:hypothetical protein BC936DRAFT_142864 [Jimgerdemannia flammicorona]|uniref:Uncharacterized protein n=1 Tax=Jimgerdemannia flammicorona TaxID=994334 RepID=A0A432ZZT5_9FUNG|nr:hypothetical protein BC936DRAFT_142864 [Jimgerdemannia flammicorona]